MLRPFYVKSSVCGEANLVPPMAFRVVGFIGVGSCKAHAPKHLMFAGSFLPMAPAWSPLRSLKATRTLISLPWAVKEVDICGSSYLRWG
jgi:hypothetical protein